MKNVENLVPPFVIRRKLSHPHKAIVNPSAGDHADGCNIQTCLEWCSKIQSEQVRKIATTKSNLEWDRFWDEENVVWNPLVLSWCGHYGDSSLSSPDTSEMVAGDTSGR